MAELQALRGRLARNPKDLAALVRLGDMEYDAQKFDRAHDYFARALALDPANPDVRTDDAVAQHMTGHDIEALGETVRERVKHHCGIELHWEIKRIGIT